MSQRFESNGTHLIADLYGIDGQRLTDPAHLATLLRSAAEQAGATVLNCAMHRFGEAGGVTGVVMLAESHISIHTWPESGFAAVDIFMCGSAAPQRALEWIEQDLRPAERRLHQIARGGANAVVRAADLG